MTLQQRIGDPVRENEALREELKRGERLAMDCPDIEEADKHRRKAETPCGWLNALNDEGLAS